MPQVRPRVSFAELQQWPPDGRRYELYDGEVFVMPSPIPRHQRVAIKIVDVLLRYERRAGGLVLGAPVDLVLTEYDVVQPDATFYLAGQAAMIDLRQPLRTPPGLIAEVLSPGTNRNDRGRKMDLYAAFGVSEYWLVDPIENSLERHWLESGVYRLDAVIAESDLLTSRLLRDLEEPAAAVFAR
jgi:Uma2 family endonuclease